MDNEKGAQELTNQKKTNNRHNIKIRITVEDGEDEDDDDDSNIHNRFLLQLHFHELESLHGFQLLLCSLGN